MPSYGPMTYRTDSPNQATGASALAANAVSMLSKRQTLTPAGARQFVLDHLLRAITRSKEFDPVTMLEELRGHRLSVDAVIDTYVPAAAVMLGDLWQEDDLDFATVTVGSMRLQSLLSIASFETLDFVRPIENSPNLLVVLPLGEQHSLGAFVVAAQLRRLGARVDMSFCEKEDDLMARVLCDAPDMILFSASSHATLEYISQIVLNLSKMSSDRPLLSVGGSLAHLEKVAKDITGVDLVTKNARDIMAAAAGRRGSFSERRHK